MEKSFLSQLVGSFAMPAAENPTVAMMEAAFRHHEMDWRPWDLYWWCRGPVGVSGGSNGVSGSIAIVVVAVFG